VIFGFTYQTAPQLLAFLKKHRAELRHLTGVRYSGELGHPFHVVDEDLWRKAMRSLQEVDVDPRRPSGPA
jgi:hypothetical protein